MKNIAILIPTCNEEIHINRCISQLKKYSSIYVLDTDSEDKTIEIAKSFGINLINHNCKFKSFSQKLNYGLNYLYKNYNWVFVLHSDEIITPSIHFLIEKISNKKLETFSGIIIKRKLSFLGNILNYGATTSNQLRFFKSNKAFYRESPIDESVLVEGKVLKTKSHIIDLPLNNFSVWLDKHSVYSINQSRKSTSSFLMKNQDIGLSQKLYENSPLIIRCFILFIFKYVFCLGFLDGSSGLAYCISHNLIYRIMVDIRIITGDMNYQNNIKHRILE